MRNKKEFRGIFFAHIAKLRRSAVTRPLADMRHLFQVSGSESIKINTAAAGQNQTKNLMSSAHSIEI